MALLGTTALTLIDHAKRLDPNGAIATVIELLNQTNEFLHDLSFVEGNLPTGHRTTVRTGLPEVYWRSINQGVPPSKSTTAQVDDTCGMLEGYSKVDKKLADLNGNTAAFRLSEDRPFMEAMSQEIASTLLYGNPAVEPKKFLGLAPRYSTLDTAKAANAQNVIDAGGTGTDNTSIWLIVYGDQTVHGIFPKGMQAGMQHKDLGEDTVSDGNGGEYQAYRTHFTWDAGLTVRDWRYAVRIANVDVSNIRTDPAAQKALINFMIDAEERIPQLGMGTATWLMNRTVRTALRKGILEKVSNNLTEESVAGKRVTMFDGIPCRANDALLNTEARVI